MSRRLACAVVALSLLAGACGGSGADPTTQSLDKSKGGKGGGKTTSTKGSKSKSGKTSGKGGSGAAGSTGTGKGSGGGAGGGRTVAAGNVPTYPTGSARLEEPEPDAQRQGVTPDYAEATSVSIEGLGKNFRITVAYAGNLPDKMPNENSYFIMGFAMQRGKNKSWAFGAQATQDGWKPYAGSKKEPGKSNKFPGKFAIEGNKIVMTIPWSYVDGAAAFEWFSNSTWFTSVASTTHYAYDPIPNEGPAKYPN
jgi:hypothetical protein